MNFDPIWSFPKPVQAGGPPILLGSQSPKTFDRVAEYCDGWMPINFPRYDLAAGLKALADAGKKAGAANFRSRCSASVRTRSTCKEIPRPRPRPADLRAAVGDRATTVLPMLDKYAEMKAKAR